MIIPCTAFGSLEEYLSSGGSAKPDVPASCPKCGTEGAFRRHGGYWRTVIEGQQVAEIKIQRCRCNRCRLVISLLYAFLLPHRRFSVRAVATGMEGYICEPGSYRIWAYETSCLPPESNPERPANEDAPVRPHYSQVFRWIKGLTLVANELLRQTQKELVLSGRPVPDACECPNGSLARSREKRTALNVLSTVLSFGKNMFAHPSEIARQLHAYFLSSAESPFTFLIGTVCANRFPQSLQQAIF